jgi:hypothetical protein
VFRIAVTGRVFERSGFGYGAIAEHVLDIDHPDDDETGSDKRRCQQQAEKPGEDTRMIWADKVSAGGRWTTRRCTSRARI